MTNTFWACTVAATALSVALARLSIDATRTDTSSPERLIAELRVAQFAALLLVLVAGTYTGFAIAHENHLSSGVDISFAVGFLIIASVVINRPPSAALTILSLAFATHALLGVVQGQGILIDQIAPTWYITGCAIYDVLFAGLCYLPLLRK